MVLCAASLLICCVRYAVHTACTGNGSYYTVFFLSSEHVLREEITDISDELDQVLAVPLYRAKVVSYEKIIKWHTRGPSDISMQHWT